MVSQYRSTTFDSPDTIHAMCTAVPKRPYSSSLMDRCCQKRRCHHHIAQPPHFERDVCVWDEDARAVRTGELLEEAHLDI